MLKPLLLAASFLSLVAIADAEPRFDPLFGDHMVLQRGRPIPVWGEAAPGEAVTVRLGAVARRGVADPQGRWRVKLPARNAGGPLDLRVEGANGAAQIKRDVLVGDVFLCSGQSNMELPVTRALNAEAEIAAARDDKTRLMSIAHAASPTPIASLPKPAEWRAVDSESVKSFSAACYFFARELRKKHPATPFGLIHSSWGGSNIQAWISDDALAEVAPYKPRVDLLGVYRRDAAAGTRAFGEVWADWWRAKTGDAEKPWLAASDAGWTPVPTPPREWRQWGVKELAAGPAIVFYRRVVTLTQDEAKAPATLGLGGIDEVDETWVNGAAVGDSFGWGDERRYAVPAGVLKAGENVITVGVINTWEAGGMIGPAKRIALELGPTTKPLGDGWTYKIAPPQADDPPRAPWHAIGGLTTISNAMIAPLGDTPLKAALWYQGESNTGDGKKYEPLLAALMKDWRGRFGAGLPFLIVQLPNFGKQKDEPGESGWANVREAQRRAVANDPHAALAVTIDVGLPNELHPPNKQAVGARLARAAERVVYGASASASGPTPKRAVRRGDEVRISFANVERALVAARAPSKFEACGEVNNSCAFVDAAFDGADAVLLRGVPATATRVRFCWGDAPVCDLTDASHLPATPFELAIDSR